MIARNEGCRSQRPVVGEVIPPVTRWMRTSNTSWPSSTRPLSSRSTSCSTREAEWEASLRRNCSTALPCRTTRLCFYDRRPLSPTTRRIRSWKRTAAISSSGWHVAGRRRNRMGWRCRSLLLHRRQRRVHFRRFHHRPPCRSVPVETSWRADHLRSAGESRGEGCRREVRRHRIDEPRGACLLQAQDARDERHFGGEVTGHYYFRDNFYADNGFIPALLILELMSKKGQSCVNSMNPLRTRNTSFPVRSIPSWQAWPPCRRSWSTSRQNTPTSGPVQAGWDFGRVPGLALQRPALEHRTTAAPESRGDNARADGGEAGRSDCADSRVIRLKSG